MCLPPGRLIEDVRPNPAVFGDDGLLLGEVAVFEHARQLDDALQLELAPAAADARPLEGVDQPLRLAAQVLPHRIERRDLLDERRAALDAPSLALLDLAVHVFERLGHRRDEILDGLLSRIDVGRRLGARLFELGLRERQELLVVVLEGFGAERGESVAELRLGVLVGAKALGVDGAIALELAPQARLLGPPRQAIPRPRPVQGRATRRR